MLASCLVPFGTILPNAPYIVGHAHLCLRPSPNMRVDLDFGDMNRPGVYMSGMMTGFKEMLQPASARRVSVEEIQSYCRDDESVGCDLELLERLRAGRGHSGSTSGMKVKAGPQWSTGAPTRPLPNDCAGAEQERLRMPRAEIDAAVRATAPEM